MDRTPLPEPGAGRAPAQPALLEDLTPLQRELLAQRFAHVMEAQTGYRSGNPLRAQAGEPRAQYDPHSTTAAQRWRAKVAELSALPPEVVRALGFSGFSERTLRRLAGRCRTAGMLGCIRGSWVRKRTGPQLGEQAREAVMAVRQETLHRSRISMKTRQRLVAQYLRERFGPGVAVPSYDTLRRVWREWFGSEGGRQRYVRSANSTKGSGQHVVVHRPGQVVALDTTVLPVKVRDGVFGQPTRANLTLGLDVYTHSLAAFRLTLVSDTAIDVAMLLRDMMMPQPMRPGWGPAMAWAYPGIPEPVVSGLAGYPVAGLPFFAPEPITTDHGAVYKNHHVIAVEKLIGTNILPARVLRPTDKQTVERAFGAIRSLLLEALPGYQGIDPADAGTDPQADAVLTLDEMEHLIATWIIGIWQNRILGEHAPSWDPGGKHGPNTLFTAAMAQGGFALQVPPPELYYAFLPVHHVKVHGQRGLKIRGLWYDGPVLDPLRHSLSERGGKHAGKWAVHRDPRDARHVFLQAPGSPPAWHRLRWTGLPPDGEVPAFGDARVRELLAAARDAGLRPRSDGEMLPLLLDLLSAHIPASKWPGKTAKADKRMLARELARANAAAADAAGPQTAASNAAQASDRHGNAVAALDSSRRKRRRDAGAAAVSAPLRLGTNLRQRSLLILQPDSETWQS